MFIAILVLLGLAVTVWYFARKQTQTVSLTADQTAELNRQIDRDAALATAAAESVFAPSSPSVEQINTVLADAPVIEESIAPITEKPSVLVEETPKPTKKKRRYYPKKK